VYFDQICITNRQPPVCCTLCLPPIDHRPLLGAVPHPTRIPNRPPPQNTCTALEKALEARKRERALTKFRDANSVADYGGPELTFAAEFQVWGPRPRE
jgi:hypothetical protein